MRTTRLLLLLAPTVGACLATGCGATEATLLLPDASLDTGYDVETGKGGSSGDASADAADSADGPADAPSEEAASCKTGQTRCGSLCVDTKTSLAHCGQCDHACNTAGGAASCTDGVCSIACSTGFKDCNNSAADGCEIDTQANTANCGDCGYKCITANGKPACVAGVCEPICNDGYADCDGNPEACEAHITEDVKNCGACGHDCLKGDCTDRKCQPVLLKAELSGPRWIAVDDSFVYCAGYVSTFATLGKVPVTGGSYEFLYNQGMFQFTSNIRQYGGNLYFAGMADPAGSAADAGAPWKLCKTTSSAPYVFACQTIDPNPTGLAVDGASIYYSIFAAHGSIGKVPIGWDIPTTLVADVPYPSRLQVDADAVFWTSAADATNTPGTGSVMGVPLAGGTPTTLASGLAFPAPIQLDAQHVYWANRQATTDHIQRVPRQGGTVETMATLPGKPTGMALDENALYVTSDITDEVYRIDLQTKEVTTLATGQDGALDIVTDATAIYWVNQYGKTVMKLAK